MRASWLTKHGPLLILVALGAVLGVRGDAPVLSADEGSEVYQPGEKIAPWLMQRLSLGGPMDMLIVLGASPDLSPAEGMTSRAEKGRFTYKALSAAALQSQGPLVAWLKGRGHDVTQFWVINAVLVRGDLSLAYDVAAFPGVSRIVGNPVVFGLDSFARADSLEAPDRFEDRLCRSEQSPTPEPFSAPSMTSDFEMIEPGIAAVNADDVWARGFTGVGIVVASMDTGVEWDHPALLAKYRGYNGGSPDHSYSWHDAIQHTTVPLDDLDHGTHTTGTMVGDDGAGGNQIGVAPGAKWVACRNMDHGYGTPATYLECIQWGLAPYPEGADPFRDGRPDLAPDITNNSWTCPPSEGCNALTLRQAFENVRAAGQMTVAAAGNSGSGCSSVSSPPAIYDSVFTTGAVNSATSLASFSSRGPVTVDGSNRMKPNVVAPGVGVRSSIRVINGSYANFSGTSMASPHNAGSLALLWSAKPNLKRLIRISRCYIEQSAGTGVTGSTQVCGGTGHMDHPNNLWGWGMINALAAVDLGPDGDGDGIADACDCSPASAAAFDIPPAVSNDRFLSEQVYSWDSLASLSGAGTEYDVARGLVSQLKADGGFGAASCRSNDQSGISYDDSESPPAGDAFYYVVRGQNACGIGSYGNRSNGTARVITACD